ncbi:hypothetical protein F7734_23370 [Scytonema sp. UIC 10036]|uniref:hypothetical protein n=1 Tax=Scytonema sp. UIC 10036 TaxID=2304196 RepID=UPI0012DA591F|nr:hypothetical protein [Scytonema sp. UIC 10036]MUG95141.1 hypothetical protein [Scytonema sp. UIC 10036]
MAVNELFLCLPHRLQPMVTYCVSFITFLKVQVATEVDVDLFVSDRVIQDE